jgi:hypothetical protein
MSSIVVVAIKEGKAEQPMLTDRGFEEENILISFNSPSYCGAVAILNTQPAQSAGCSITSTHPMSSTVIAIRKV